MLKKIGFAVAILVVTASVGIGQDIRNQGPFGFQWGMTRDQVIRLVGAEAVIGTENDILILSTAPKPHPHFDRYRLMLSPEKGLVKLLASGKTIQTNVYGAELRDEFAEIENQISRTYGKASKYDYLRTGSIWDEPKDWMTALQKKERTLASFWDTSVNHITSVELEANALSTSKGWLTLSYEFEGFSEYLDSKKAKAGTVF